MRRKKKLPGKQRYWKDFNCKWNISKCIASTVQLLFHRSITNIMNTGPDSNAKLLLLSSFDRLHFTIVDCHTFMNFCVKWEIWQCGPLTICKLQIRNLIQMHDAVFVHKCLFSYTCIIVCQRYLLKHFYILGYSLSNPKFHHNQRSEYKIW